MTDSCCATPTGADHHAPLRPSVDRIIDALAAALRTRSFAGCPGTQASGERDDVEGVRFRGDLAARLLPHLRLEAVMSWHSWHAPRYNLRRAYCSDSGLTR
jgi:hypothetical protein